MKTNYGLVILLLLGSLSAGCNAADKMKKLEAAVIAEMDRPGADFKSTMKVFEDNTNALVRSSKAQEYSAIFGRIVAKFSKTDSASGADKLSKLEKAIAEMGGASKKEKLKAFEAGTNALVRSAAPNAYIRVYNIATEVTAGGAAAGKEGKEEKEKKGSAAAEAKTVEDYFNEFWTLVETQVSENGSDKQFHDLKIQLDKPEKKEKIQKAFRAAKPADAAKATAAVRDGVATMFGGQKTDGSAVATQAGDYNAGKSHINKTLPRSVPLFKVIEDEMGVSAAAA